MEPEYNFNLDIEQTLDNSPTLYRRDIDEHYHSTKGAVTEALHVYVKSGLEYHPKKTVRVCEIGFGAGLNALTTAMLSKKKSIEYHTFELFPLSAELCKSLDYHTEIDNSVSAWGEELRNAIHDAEWEKPVRITDRFVIHKHLADITKGIQLQPESVDVVYFDAFAPEKQPEMWSNEIFSDIYKIMTPGGVLPPYSAKGAIRRLL
ncbi:MAG: tRNA (5-methylaminomethyl-2-thiouridine)(34)-methyltransferase MnmD, partial [Muribaculaceae bacterium]|nr:tRNA (5-methylaminomethyl-2-thiouridine)(34)-methyltransferase MnmD [Muribaculaceae bacterium]